MPLLRRVFKGVQGVQEFREFREFKKSKKFKTLPLAQDYFQQLDYCLELLGLLATP